MISVMELVQAGTNDRESVDHCSIDGHTGVECKVVFTFFRLTNSRSDGRELLLKWHALRMIFSASSTLFMTISQRGLSGR